MLYAIDSTCRSCLKDTATDIAVSLFEYCCVDSNNFLISDLFEIFTNVDINKDDNLPTQICESCLDELISVYRFQKKCQQSDEILKADTTDCDSAGDVEFKEEYLNDAEACTQVEMEQLNETMVNEQNYNADESNNSCTSIADYSIHKVIRNPKHWYNCDYCDKGFPRKIMKLNHQRIHTTDHPFKCSVCQVSKMTKSSLVKHLTTHINKLRCDVCDLNFESYRLEVLHFTRKENCPKHQVARSDFSQNTVLDTEEIMAREQINTIQSTSKSRKKNLQVQCKICAIECSTPAELRQHLELHNNTELETNPSSPKTKEGNVTNYKCSESKCGKIFTSSISYREHKKIHNPESAVKCDYCDKMFSSKARREPHHRVHRGERPYKCSVCPEARTTKSTLLKHLLCHARSLKCKPCGINFESSRSYVSHMKIHEEDPNYEPNNDSEPEEELDENQRKLREHIEEIRSTSLAQKRNINTKCTICYREFATPSELKLHAEIHQDVGDYLCTICGKISLTKAGHREHLALHESSGTFQCEYCNEVFSSNHRLKAHILQHTGEQPHLCKVCGKSFSTAIVLRVHNRLHTGEKPFKCIVDGCAAAFRTASKLNRHRIATHTNIRPFECIICSKKFAFSDEYKSHSLIHSTDTPYECGVCGKGFHKNHCLKSHLRIHTGEKPYKCEVCGKAYRLRNALTSHLKACKVNEDEAESN